MLASITRRLVSQHVLRSSSVVSSTPLVVRYMSSDLPYHIVAGMPALSPTMEVGTLSSWSMKEGDSFGAGDVIAKIETDKASIDFEAQDDGYIAKLLIPDGSEDVPVGAPIMVTVEDEGDVAAFENFTLPEEEATAAAPPEETKPAEVVSTPPPPPSPEPTPLPIVEPAVAAAVEPASAVAAPVAADVPPTMAPAWGGSSRVTSAIANTLSKNQKAYVDLYGTTGQIPL
eukprot:CAMPEP_0194131824 /NCGR_PEP_ID=MMETSP0152-20130528/2483_1 /TAXON_ID=1049557 /ORGANISM="Thalassiothrix antarctica, Strain L6-D1" /LENGTH=228 /DNA_ID=CAMNT_0038826705 /DNA_START=26 /DNA_END=712 /DNA_ORIENTATION=+